MRVLRTSGSEREQNPIGHGEDIVTPRVTRWQTVKTNVNRKSNGTAQLAVSGDGWRISDGELFVATA
jgi:hypothetical protein